MKKISLNLKRALIKKKIKRAILLLEKIDDFMQEEGWSRQRRRQFWRDFISSPGSRGQVTDAILARINGGTKK